jgi:hypothetical protein
MMKYLAFMFVVLSSTVALAGGGSYFSGPGRSPSYGPAAIANGFGSGSSNQGQGQQASGSGSGSKPSSTAGSGNSGHHDSSDG